MTHPYAALESSAYWKTAVAEMGAFGVSGLWTPKFAIRPEHRIVTAGSCFAQHIGRALAGRGYHWVDAEPAPPFLSEEDARRFNYGIFSFRTGNIYTPRMLAQWLDLALDEAAPPAEVWQDADGRLRDPMRPVIEPEGFASRDDLVAARRATCAAIRDAVTGADLFVFTLGLTESWIDRESGLEYALCPGTAGGRFDPDRHDFNNAGFAETELHLTRVLDTLRAANPKLRVLLTVSPVPLTATASGEHVLTATQYSKSVLRAVAGETARQADWIDYFPSFEIITHPVFGGMFYAPNARSVVPQGVAFVMEHFFADQARVFGAPEGPAAKSASGPRRTRTDIVCEEELLSVFSG